MSDYVYSLNPDNTYTITKYNGTDIIVTVPAEYQGKPVTFLGNNAFQYASVTSVIIQNPVTTINGAFRYCTSLTSVTIPNSVTSMINAFADCTSLTSVTIPNSVTTIDEAFIGCTSLTSVTIPNSVTSMINAFAFCTSLTSVIIPNSVTLIGENTFENCTSLTSVIIPNSVTLIGENTFEQCTSLTSVIIPNSVTSIGSGAFGNCTSLTSVIIPNSVTSIGSSAFENCTSLTSVIIPNSVTLIGNNTFENCTSLTSVIIPNSVTSIGNFAFKNCNVDIYDLTQCTPILYADTFINNKPVVVWINQTTTIPAGTASNVTYIVFNVLTFLLNLDDTYTLSKCIGTITSLSIPDMYQGKPVTSIGNSAFSECTSLTSVIIPTSITSIGSSAFRGCALRGTLILPPNLTVLEEYVFAECDFTSMAPPTQLMSIGARAFYNLPLFVYDFTQCEQLAYIDPSAFDEYNQSFLDINVYVTRFTYDRLQFSLFPHYVKFHTGVPVSNICFVAGTRVQTDQGILAIETLNRKHTLNGQPITLTKTKHEDPYLVKIQAYAFTNTPTQDTYMSMNHRIYFNHDRVKARDLVNGDTVTLVDYHGEPLYNVLVKAHTSMLVHGMRVETLDPTSPIALVYTSRLPPLQRIQIIQKLNTQENYEETVMYLKRIQ